MSVPAQSGSPESPQPKNASNGSTVSSITIPLGTSNVSTSSSITLSAVIPRAAAAAATRAAALSESSITLAIVSSIEPTQTIRTEIEPLADLVAKLTSGKLKFLVGRALDRPASCTGGGGPLVPLSKLDRVRPATSKTELRPRRKQTFRPPQRSHRRSLQSPKYEHGQQPKGCPYRIEAAYDPRSGSPTAALTEVGPSTPSHRYFNVPSVGTNQRRPGAKDPLFLGAGLCDIFHNEVGNLNHFSGPL